MKQAIFSALVVVCAILVGYWWVAVAGILAIDIFSIYMIQKRKSLGEAFDILTPSMIYQIVGGSLGAALLYLAKSLQSVV